MLTLAQIVDDIERQRAVTATELQWPELERQLFDMHFPLSVEQVACSAALLLNAQRRHRYRFHAQRLVARMRRDAAVRTTCTPAEMLRPPVIRRATPATADIDEASEIAEVPENPLLTCRRCHSHRIVFTQRQTRSADEPMTSFFLCVACKKRWKQ